MLGKIYRRKFKLSKNVGTEFNEIFTLYIYFSPKNIICTLTNNKKEVITWVSTGCLKFKGHKKATPMAAYHLVKRLESILYSLKIKKVNLELKNDNDNRIEFLNFLFNSRLKIMKITEKTSIPFNGCRPQKRKKL